ncbi:hemolysin activation/secretion signal peptide protein [Janthinobacterium sp. Marseille]|nr:ShlB/FhaC/HecB family hemolysin secretion/activation protein [Janthinobacterium sp. Marseille]ABR89676.1 hemolysin activation/secretion signal peptide protein [Janthinobacterium sp. Marseille]
MTSYIRSKQTPFLCALTLTLLYSTNSTAQTLPNAGQILRELQQQPELVAPKAGPTLEVEERTLNATADQGSSFALKTITITGNTTFTQAELHALVSDLEGGTRTLKDLNAAAERITVYYREQGYPVARAYLPAQEIKDGVVTIAVVEGRIAARQLNNKSHLSDERAAAYLDRSGKGGVIRSDSIDRGLLLLNDTPGVTNARATLQPGASVGTSDLVVQLEPGAAYSGNIDFDNYGNRYVGAYRLGGTLNINSPLQIGDVLTANVLTSGSGLNYGRVAYQLPVGSDGLRVGAAYFETRYELDKEFKRLDAHGTASSASIFAAYPFIRSQFSNLNGTLSWEQKNLSDSVDATATTTDKRAKLLTAGLFGTRQDAFGGGGINSLSLSAIFGQLDIKSASALIIDNASAKTNGNYSRWSYNLARLQRISDSNSLYLTVSGQEAGKNLDSSEKFALGGATGVRAYPQGEGIGDEGVLASIELRHTFMTGLQGSVFYDTGSVKINHTPFGPPQTNTRTLSGAGVGVNAFLANVQIKASLAWRTYGGAPTSIPEWSSRGPTAWLQASLGF